MAALGPRGGKCKQTPKAMKTESTRNYGGNAHHLSQQPRKRATITHLETSRKWGGLKVGD